MATPDFKYWHQIYKDEAAKCNKWEREGALFFVKRERGDGDEPEEQVKQWKKDAAVKQEAVIGKMDCAGEIGDGKPAVWYCPTKSETGIKVSYIWIKSLTQGLIAGKEIKDGEEPRIEFDIPEHCTSIRLARGLAGPLGEGAGQLLLLSVREPGVRVRQQLVRVKEGALAVGEAHAPRWRCQLQLFLLLGRRAVLLAVAPG